MDAKTWNPGFTVPCLGDVGPRWEDKLKEGSCEEFNALVIYGGGLCDSAAYCMSEFAQTLSRRGVFSKVFVGYFSFCALLCEKLIKEWSDDEYAKAQSVKGGYYGTARETDLTQPGMIERAIEVCKKRHIKWIFLGGGDGSSRQMDEIQEQLAAAGIYMVFFMANTIDGIEGGYSFGLNAAVAKCLDKIRNVSSTCLRTLDGNKYPAAVVVVPGRNRDNILAEVIKMLDQKKTIGDFEKDEIELICIPANNFTWNPEKASQSRLAIGVEAVSEYEVYGKPKLIIVSEGAEESGFPLDEDKLKSITGVKTRVSLVAHEGQVNGRTSEEEKRAITDVINMSMDIIVEKLRGKPESYTILTEKNGDNFVCSSEASDYFAKRNPRTGQTPTLSPELQQIIKRYLPY